MGSIASETSYRASERERESVRESEREGEGALSIYNATQQGTVGVQDAALWKGPRMAALKLAAVAAPQAIKAYILQGC